MGDGGVIAQIKDAAGATVAVSNSDWQSLVIHTAPLDKSCEGAANPVAGKGACAFEVMDEPDGWDQAGFDASDWPQASTFSERHGRLQPAAPERRHLSQPMAAAARQEDHRKVVLRTSSLPRARNDGEDYYIRYAPSETPGSCDFTSKTVTTGGKVLTRRVLPVTTLLYRSDHQFVTG